MSMDNGTTGSNTFRSGGNALDVDTMADEDELASSPGSASGAANGGTTSLTDQVKDTAQQAVAQTQQVAGQALDKAKDTVKSQLSSQKDRAADTLGGFTQALHQTGQQLRQSGQGVFGDYADSLAGQVDRAVSFLRENDVDDLTRQVEDFARNQPALFVGGAFVLGVAIARFLKSSSEPQFATAANTSGGGTGNYNYGAAPASLTSTGRENGGMSDSGKQKSSDRDAGSHIPDQVYGNADPSRHLDQFSDDAIPDNPVPSAHGYVAGVGTKGDDSAQSDAKNVVSESAGGNGSDTGE